MITRRFLLKTAVAAFASIYCRKLAAWEIGIRMVHEFLKCQGAQLSPDGKKICFVDWSRRGQSPFRVVDTEIYSKLFECFFKYNRGMIGFADDNHLLVKEGVPPTNNEKLSLIDIYSSKRTEHVLMAGDPYLKANILPVSSQRLLARLYDPVPSNITSLSLVEFPGLREIAREPYAIEARLGFTKIGGMSLSNNFDLKVSAQRDMLVYSYDHTVLCRSAEDLRILWKQRMEPPLKAHDLAISADGAHVAAFATNSQWSYDRSENIIFVYDGKTGEFKSRVTVAGAGGYASSIDGDGLAISPDGKLLAITDIQQEKKEWVVLVHIHDAAGGERLTSILHDRLKGADKTRLPAYALNNFTPDGGRLITSGINTKIWSIEQNI